MLEESWAAAILVLRSFVPSQFQVNTKPPGQRNHRKPPQQSEWVNVPVFNCLRALLLFNLQPRDPAGFSKAVVLNRTAAFLSWGMQRWSGARWTLHMGWRSGTGHSETLSWATCAEVVKLARRALHSVSLAVSVSVGGQRAGGASGHADPRTSFRHKPVWLRAAGSCSKNLTLTVFAGLYGHYNSVSIKPSLIHAALLKSFPFYPTLS